MKLANTLKAAAAALLLAAPANAWAQQAGTYNGTTADGNSVSFAVGTDGNGNLAITGATIWFLATCAATGDTVNEGWGFGTDDVITGNKVDFAGGSDDFYIYAPGTVVFRGNTMSGHLDSRETIFKTNSTPPSGAQLCISPSQTFSATLSEPAHAPVLSAGSAMHLAGSVHQSRFGITH